MVRKRGGMAVLEKEGFFMYNNVVTLLEPEVSSVITFILNKPGRKREWDYT